MESYLPHVLVYWILSGLMNWGILWNMEESTRSLSQRGEKGRKGSLSRFVLHFLFGGAILPMIVLIGGAISGLAVFATIAENAHSKAK
jgi:hypothetical protein